MPVSSERFSKPIRHIEDIQKFFGYSKGTNLGYIISNAAINKWSRHKPIRNSSTSALSDADFVNANFGLSMPSYYPQDFKGAINNATYDYNRPRGYKTNNEWFRTRDFDLYSHSSLPPCKKCADFTFDTTVVDNQFTIFLTLNQMGHDDYNIGLDEFPMFADKYLAVILEYDDGQGHTYNLWKTASQTLGNSGFSVTFENLSKDSMKNIKYYVCAASRIQEQQISSITYVDFYGLPFNQPSDAFANVTITASNPFQVNFLGCAQSYDSTSYTPKEDAVPGGQAFALTGNKGLWVQSEITALLTYTGYFSDLKGEIRPCSVYGTATDKSTTTGAVPMEMYILKGSTWEKVSTNYYTFEKGKTYSVRIGRQDWAYYQDGQRKDILKSNYIYDDGYVWVYDQRIGYYLGGITSCRIGLFPNI